MSDDCLPPPVDAMSTERITIRLPSAQTAKMDALVALGQYATRTEVVRHALRTFFEQQGEKAPQTMQAEEQMQKLVKLAALVKENKDLFEAL